MTVLTGAQLLQKHDGPHPSFQKRAAWSPYVLKYPEYWKIAACKAFVMILSRALVFSSLLVLSLAQKPECTLQPSSTGDDSPQLTQAVKTCSVVMIPRGKTITVATRLNMTGLADIRIVSLELISLLGSPLLNDRTDCTF